MKNFALVLSAIFLLACSRNPDHVRREIKKLEGVEAELKQQIDILSAQRIELSQKVDEQKFKIHVQEGGSVRYVLKLKLKQERGFNMDLDKALKDMMNECVFELPVDRQFFNSVKVGQKILNEFRRGSATMEASSSSWVIQVVDKQKELVE